MKIIGEHNYYTVELVGAAGSIARFTALKKISGENPAYALHTHTHTYTPGDCCH
jgi:hypothetical protein